MKKTLITSLGVLMFSLAINVGAIAQHTAQAIFHDPPEFISKYFESKSNRDSMMESPAVYINTKAVRHFIKSFKVAKDVHWFKALNGIVVHFTMQGIKSKAYYDEKGNWLYTIRTCKESNLSKDIRNLVKRTYYDYSIASVNEISDEQRIVYIIQLEDKTTLKSIGIYDGEMNLIKEYVKSK